MALRSSFVVLLSCLIFAGCKQKVAVRPEAKPVVPVLTASSPAVSTYQFTKDELESASDYLTTLTFARVNKQLKRTNSDRVLSCDPKSDQTINAWMMSLKSLIDEQNQSADANVEFQPLSTKEAAVKYKWFCNSELHKYLKNIK